MVPIMNASAMRREGRKNFCPEDTPAEYFKRVGRKPSTYAFMCFSDGWYEEEREYEKSLIKEDVQMTARNELLGALPQDVQDAINDEGSSEDAVCDAAEDHIMDLESQLAEFKKAKARIKKLEGVEVRLVGMTEVLKEALKILEANADLNADLVFQNDQGSEHREFDYGTYCGRTAFANQLYLMLTE